MHLAQAEPTVAELQGLYGPFSFAEKLLQKIWLRGDFDRRALRATDGRCVGVRHPGKWNLLGGPDFRGARLSFDRGAEVTGDVELHLQAADWAAHAHARDPAYDRVILHAVLFPPPAGHVTRGVDEREIPVVALLPHLHHDLEEYAAEEAVELLAGRASARIPDELATLESAALMALLSTHAAARWRQKVRFAGLRVQRLGWEAACHQTALEILGYRFNRAPMLRVATRWSLPAWARGGTSSDEMFVAEEDGWSLQGVRPANYPRTRLRQYAAWVRARPDWPAALATIAQRLPPADIATGVRETRRVHALTKFRAVLARDICGDAIGGTRLDNLVCDGFLPLLAAHSGVDAHGLWSHWFPGDLPPMLAHGLRDLGIFDGRVHPANHGAAQGLLGWLLERESRG
jgi:hypothetical protein